ncbi:hypothetical protein [Methylobacterium sp. J-068]|uniref:hypothetical protein n=1 Tax=Methylobacterium sp. J-068 TaxID=2836649 RepID=UPI001FB9DBEC|nr:hypothetical protein [Methylobacterium sp. J-068]MCJ2033204.1 hypothetical protein [Methylobacterium sp. J-068]
MQKVLVRETLVQEGPMLAADDGVRAPYLSSEALARELPPARLDRVSSGGHAYGAPRAEAFNRTLVAFPDSQE